jgi:hypothetical protein
MQDKESKNWGFEQWQSLDTELNEEDRGKVQSCFIKFIMK